MADDEKVISSSSGFGEIDHQIIEREINNSSSKRQLCVKHSPEERYKIEIMLVQMAQLPL